MHTPNLVGTLGYADSCNFVGCSKECLNNIHEAIKLTCNKRDYKYTMENFWSKQTENVYGEFVCKIDVLYTEGSLHIRVFHFA